MEIKDVFGAQPRSVWEYLCENGQGLYIPAYQRQYSWDKDKISRLFEDASHGFDLLVSRDDAITFLGTIIAIHDTQLLTVQPIVRGDTPAKVMTIIDGQQRLTTLLLMNTILHEELRVRSKKFRKSERPEDAWLTEESMKVIGRLGKTFEEDMIYGDGELQFYPRMIRSYDDSWSRKKGKARYSSPIGSYLHTYGAFFRKNPEKGFKYEHSNPSQKFLVENRNYISRLTKIVAKGGANKGEKDDIEFPSLTRICVSEKLQNTLIKSTFPDDVKAILVGGEEDEFKELARIVLFANFVLDRVAITIVTAKNEDYAFDMFEALNTTGEPLTAFETFKPKIIVSERLGDYENSESRKYVDDTESYLESFARASDKQDATSRLIIAFALAETGDKESKRLSDQRRYLRDSFDTLGSAIDEQRSYIRHLSHAALFLKHCWPDDKKALPKIHMAPDAEVGEVILCLDFLRQMNHLVTQGPLIRYYSAILQSTTDKRADAVANFVAAMKAVAGFSVLWRSSRRTTENIDSHYRDLMKVGLTNAGLAPLARRGAEVLPSAESLKAAFRAILAEKGGVTGKDDWVKLVVKIPAYTNQSQITKFILLAAAHDSAEDSTSPGLTKVAKFGALPMLKLDVWRDAAQTVEHVAPQGNGEGWSPEIYVDSEVVDRLGNLTLLPPAENSSLGNGSWERKRLYFRVLSAPTPDELEPLLEQAKAAGMKISQSTAELLERSPYLPWVRSLASVDQWDVDMIDSRSANIAQLAWDRVAPWLGYA